MRILIIFLVSLFVTLPFSAYGKDFTRDYIYRAGDDDSKNSARLKALEQAKLLLLEEIGIYIQSYIEIDKGHKGGDSYSFLSHEIRTTTAGITKTRLLTEEWDGKEYKLTVGITVDVEDVIKRINDTIKTREDSKNVAELNMLIKKKDSEISEVSTALRLKKIESNKQKIRLAQLENNLVEFKLLLNEQIQHERQLKNDLARINFRIKTATNIVNELTPGMTVAEVIRVAGNPSARDECPTTDDEFLNYGSKWIHMANGIYKGYVPIGKYSGSCNAGIDF